MANKGPSFGMSRQVQDKIDSKYDPELELILVEWISRQCGSGVGKPEEGKMGFQAWLKDGCVSATYLFDYLFFLYSYDVPRLMGFFHASPSFFLPSPLPSVIPSDLPRF